MRQKQTGHAYFALKTVNRLPTEFSRQMRFTAHPAVLPMPVFSWHEKACRFLRQAGAGWILIYARSACPLGLVARE